MSFIASAFGTKVALVAISLAAIGGGTAVAAATGGLSGKPGAEATGSAVVDTANPTPTAEPTETPTPEETETPSPDAAKGPDATGPAAFGLCTAYTAGGLNSTSVAYTALLTASVSLGSITDYCSPILAAHVSNDHNPDSATEKSNGQGRSDQDKGKGSPETPDE